MTHNHTVAGTNPAGLGGQQPGDAPTVLGASDRRAPGRRQQSWLKGRNPKSLAKALGWFSVGLGLAEIVMPRQLTKFLGVGDRTALLFSLGAREIASGIGILSRREPTGWLWARVAGDAMDLTLLGAALMAPRVRHGAVAAATAAVAGVTALDVLAAQQFSQSEVVRVRKSVIVNRPAEELYQFWHGFENLPRFMKHLKAVEVIGERRSRWVANGPGGAKIEWEAETTADQPNERIAWCSLEGSAVDNRGEVRFVPATGGRGTVVRVDFEYRPPAGRLGSLVAKLFGREPGQQVQEDLRRFKRLMETGEIITTEGQPAGRSSSTSWKYDQSVRRQARPIPQGEKS